jgi:hypothetical protein
MRLPDARSPDAHLSLPSWVCPTRVCPTHVRPTLICHCLHAFTRHAFARRASPDARSPDALRPTRVRPTRVRPTRVRPTPDARSPDARSPDARSPDLLSPNAICPTTFDCLTSDVVFIIYEVGQKNKLSESPSMAIGLTPQGEEEGLTFIDIALEVPGMWSYSVDHEPGARLPVSQFFSLERGDNAGLFKYIPTKRQRAQANIDATQANGDEQLTVVELVHTIMEGDELSLGDVLATGRRLLHGLAFHLKVHLPCICLTHISLPNTRSPDAHLPDVYAHLPDAHSPDDARSPDVAQYAFVVVSCPTLLLSFDTAGILYLVSRHQGGLEHINKNSRQV